VIDVPGNVPTAEANTCSYYNGTNAKGL
jgi:hypothetical protein